MSSTAFQNACGEIVTITRHDDGRLTVVHPGLTLPGQSGVLLDRNVLQVDDQRYTLSAEEACSIRQAMEQLSPPVSVEPPRPPGGGYAGPELSPRKPALARQDLRMAVALRSDPAPRLFWRQ